jgi:hypothetical protein
MIRVFSIFFFLMILSACGSEAPVKNADELILGHWELSEASRNGKPTNTLEGLYFDFFQDGHMRTNFPGQAGSARYRIIDNVVEQYETDQPLKLAISSLSDSTLIFETEIQAFHFQLNMKKVLLEN